MNKILLILICLASSQAFALDPKKCFKVTHGDGLIKYDFPGYSSGEYLTKKYGTTGGTTEGSSQGTTAMADPSVTSGRITSTVQFTSSEGGCSYYSYNRQLRKEYITRNNDSILEQIAKGHGEHLKSLYFYSSCRDGNLNSFNSILQNNFGRLRMSKDANSLDDQIESLIQQNEVLQVACELS